jgi:hypothetical protein
MIKLRISPAQWFTIIFLFSVAMFASCTRNQSNPIVQPPCNLPDTVSFKNDIIPVFELSCDQANCHSGTDTSSRGRVNLKPAYAYNDLFKQHLIDTLNPTQSQLYQRLVSTGNSMPPGIYLDNCTIQSILKWIEQGAKNN